MIQYNVWSENARKILKEWCFSAARRIMHAFITRGANTTRDRYESVLQNLFWEHFRPGGLAVVQGVLFSRLDRDVAPLPPPFFRRPSRSAFIADFYCSRNGVQVQATEVVRYHFGPVPSCMNLFTSSSSASKSRKT